MLKIYHNPRCSKSRQTLALIEDQQPEVIEYLKTPPSAKELQQVITALNISPRDLLRTKEVEYKQAGLDNSELSDAQVIEQMVAFPKLIERPLVINGDKAAIGRPPESVLEIL